MNTKYTSAQPAAQWVTTLDGDWKPSYRGQSFKIVQEKALAFSIISSLGPLKLLPGFDQLIPSNIAAAVLGLVQSILSTLLLFLFISNIKRRLSILN